MILKSLSAAVGAIVSATAAAACCAPPILAGIMGAGMSGLGGPVDSDRRTDRIGPHGVLPDVGDLDLVLRTIPSITPPPTRQSPRPGPSGAREVGASSPVYQLSSADCRLSALG